MKRLIILGIVICAGTLCTHLSAQVIEGKVTDASQQGIDGATVILQLYRLCIYRSNDNRQGRKLPFPSKTGKLLSDRTTPAIPDNKKMFSGKQYPTPHHHAS